MATSKEFVDQYSNERWMKTGIIWGVVAFVVVIITAAYFEYQELSWKNALIDIIVCLVLGVLYSFCMKVYFKKYPPKLIKDGPKLDSKQTRKENQNYFKKFQSGKRRH